MGWALVAKGAHSADPYRQGGVRGGHPRPFGFAFGHLRTRAVPQAPASPHPEMQTAGRSLDIFGGASYPLSSIAAAISASLRTVLRLRDVPAFSAGSLSFDFPEPIG
jgi:hypothetical protein